jgi:glycosyltransferase involved in cell wall biosynthesis
MKIAVVSPMLAGSKKANAINTAKMAQGFARLGHEVTLICRAAEDQAVDENTLINLYGLTTFFSWLQIPDHWSWLPASRLTNLFLNNWAFGWDASRVIKTLRPDFVFSRHYIVPWFAAHQQIPTAAESHAHPGMKRPAFHFFIQSSNLAQFRLLVTISNRLKANFIDQGVPVRKLVVLEDAVDLALFQRPDQLPAIPYLSSAAPQVTYAGHLYDYKGIPTILKCAELMPTVQFNLVGGFPEDIERQKKLVAKINLSNVNFHGFVDQANLPSYLWHADVLLLPPSLNHPSASWTSPVKLYEYLAAETPVVASEIPALTDWLSADEVEFFEPDNAQAMVAGIRKLIDDKQRAATLRMNGYQRALTKSYTQRAQQILKYAGVQ